MRIAGLGYKASSRGLLSRKCGKHASRLHIMWLHTVVVPSYGIGMALNIALGVWVEPEVMGELYEMRLENTEFLVPTLLLLFESKAGSVVQLGMR